MAKSFDLMRGARATATQPDRFDRAEEALRQPMPPVAPNAPALEQRPTAPPSSPPPSQAASPKDAVSHLTSDLADNFAKVDGRSLRKKFRNWPVQTRIRHEFGVKLVRIVEQTGKSQGEIIEEAIAEYAKKLGV
ncbi:MAG: hypothetical protein F9K30_18480 [Dechloromonas sp.]|jgi:hypothetical protein|nr:MAG: hypothetical protein F9K30_18480 [Dechloromonas sp.]